MITVDIIPDEIFLHVFSFLRFQDRKRCRLVCKRWMRICQSVSLISNDTVVIDDYNNIAKYVPNNIPAIVNLKVFVKDQTVESSCNPELFLAECSSYVKFVHLVFRYIDPVIVKEILRLCPNIKHLVIGQLDDPDVANTVIRDGTGMRFSITLEELPLCKPCKNFEQHSPNALSTTQLVKLELVHVDCPHIFKIVSDASPGLKSVILHRHEDVDCEEEVIGDFNTFLERPNSAVNEVSIYNSPISICQVLHSANNVGENIISLKVLNHIGALDSLYFMCRSIRNLQEFHMYGYTYYGNDSDDGLDDFIISNSMLTHISLSSINVDNSTIAAVASLSNLVSLELDNCYHVTNRGLRNLFGSASSPKIQCLYLRQLEITDDCLLAIIPKLSNLKYFRLEECSNVTNISLAAVFKNLKKLRYLSVANSKKLSNLSIGDSIGALTDLVHLNINGCNFLRGDEELDQVTYISYVLSQIKSVYLESLFLNSKAEIDPKDLKGLECDFNQRHNLLFIGVNLKQTPYIRGFNTFHMVGNVITRELEIENTIFFCGGWRKIPTPVKCWQD